MTMTDEHLELLAESNTDADATIRTVVNNADTIFTWDYEKGARPGLNKLYEKAKHSQWDGEKDLDWSIDVDQEKLVRESGIPNRDTLRQIGINVDGTILEKWGDDEWLKFEMESGAWALSQFMHGEQGALVCTAKIVETVTVVPAPFVHALP